MKEYNINFSISKIYLYIIKTRLYLMTHKIENAKFIFGFKAYRYIYEKGLIAHNEHENEYIWGCNSIFDFKDKDKCRLTINSTYENYRNLLLELRKL